MAMSVTYTNFGGRIVHESRNGVEREYVGDPLGSTVALRDSSFNVTDTWEYWPYGEVAARSGSNPTPFTFVGMLGYYKDILDKLMYVRARYLRTDLGRWLTVDPLWPMQKAYAYVGNRPVAEIDPSGLVAIALPFASLAALLGAFLTLLEITVTIAIITLLLLILQKLTCSLAKVMKKFFCDRRPKKCNECDTCAILGYKLWVYFMCFVSRVAVELYCFWPWQWGRGGHGWQIKQNLSIAFSCFKLLITCPWRVPLF